MAPQSETTTREATTVAKVVLDLTAAEEVVELIDDVPGMADEDLLDDALWALASAGPRVPTEGQQKAAQGEAVAIELTPAAAAAVETLIRRNRATESRALQAVARRLRSKVKRARQKSTNRPRRGSV